MHCKHHGMFLFCCEQRCSRNSNAWNTWELYPSRGANSLVRWNSACSKKVGQVRICVDLRHLNSSVLRKVHPIPRIDNSIAQLAGATVFSKVDANSGFWQVPLAERSRLLTTFITSFGRFCFNKLPFGILSAPQLFQRTMSVILSGLPGVLCHTDDVLTFGSNQAENDVRLADVLTRIQEAGVTLNASKCEFSVPIIKF